MKVQIKLLCFRSAISDKPALFCVNAMCLIWIILTDKVTVVMVWRVVGVGMHEVTSIETAAKDH